MMCKDGLGPPRALRAAQDPPLPARGVSPGADGVLEWTFRSGDLETRALLAEICAQMSAQGVNGPEIGTIELVLAEVLNNISEHAYGPRPGDVRLQMEVDAPLIRCSFSDRGRPMPAGKLPPPGLPHRPPPRPLPEGGFGWHIIRSLASELTYSREAGCNRLSFTLDVSKPV